VPPYYLTTPIYYVNDAPHVGTAYTTVNADALARWHRLIGDEVTFLTGTDEHGAKIVEAAEAHGMTPQAWTDQTSARFVEAWARLNISNDDFIRTTEPRHYAAVQQFLQQIYDNGFIKLAQYTGLYCVSCEDYYTADQLVDGLCPVHGRAVIEMQEDNYFFTLSAFEQPLLDYYDSHPDFVRPTAKRNEALGFIRGGLQDVSITRTSMQWGVPVPWDSGHVFYVWYDALINYLTAASYGTDPERFDALWGAAHHLIGKDILKFHCVWWPAMCMAAGIAPPEEIFVHGYLLMGGQKLGKTLIQSGVVGEGDEARSLKITEVSPLALADEFGVDPLRYHLLRDIALGGDGDFSYEGIVARYNADLANNLGNLVSRVATVVHSKCGGTGPAPDPAAALAGPAAEVLSAASEAWARWAPQDALAATWRLIGAANSELETTEPWKMDPGPEIDLILGNALEVLRIVAILIAPAMPATAAEIWRRIGLGGDLAAVRLPADGAWGGYGGGHPVVKGDPLFPRRKS
jgi:methionyl-tRNA synthetase